MLRKDVDIDYVPISPKKPRPLGVTPKVRELRELSTGSRSMPLLGTHPKDPFDISRHHYGRDTGSDEHGKSKRLGYHGIRTTDEKKEILGGLLGNVDALVEGVRKAGIWGLG